MVGGHALHRWALASVLILVAAVGQFAADPLQRWEERLADLTWWAASQSAGEGVAERRIVIVDIDEKSVAALGPWPWPRERVAHLLEKLDAHGVGLKIVDILFDGRQPGDERLAAALAGGAPSVIAQLFSLQPDQAVRAGQPAQPWLGVCEPGMAQAYGHLAPPPMLAAAAGAVGHITPIVDADGVIRRVPALICQDGKPYPALALSALALATVQPHEAPPLLLPARGMLAAAAEIVYGERRLPIGDGGDWRVAWRLPRNRLVSVSAVDLLNDAVPAEMLAGVWALVGATAMGGGDVVATPQGGAVGGIEVHAQLLAAALDERTPYVPRWAPLWLPLTLLFGIGLLLLALRIGSRQGSAVLQGLLLPAAAVLASLVVVGLHAALLLGADQWLGWGRPLLVIGATAAALGVAELLRVRLQRERLYRNLASYLPADAARRVAFAAPSAQAHAERRDATVMCVDLRNFTAYCEGRSPEAAATVLHLFYTTLDRLVTEHGGVVEQMVGDSILAVWNGSSACAGHAHAALGAARAVRTATLAILPAGGSRQTPPLDLGIGIESGEILVGSFGPARRRVHSVLGEAVSVAVQLEHLTAELGYPILLGPGVVTQTAAHAAPDECAAGDGAAHRPTALGEFLLDGSQRPRTLYALPVALDMTHLRVVYTAEAA